MVHFPRFAPPGGGVTLLNVTGFPIRVSSDQRLLTAPRRLIAVRRALHRLSVPRHPPYTLSTLINTFKRLYVVPANLTQQ